MGQPVLEYIVQKQNSVVTFSRNNSVWAHKGFGRSSMFCSRDQKCLIISSEPISAGPTMIKVVVNFPPIYITELINKFALFTNNHMPKRLCTAADVIVSSANFSKQRAMQVQVNRLLIMQKNIISFGNIISTKVKQRIRITASRWVAKKCSSARQVFVQPRPECIIVNFVYSNHV